MVGFRNSLSRNVALCLGGDAPDASHADWLIQTPRQGLVPQLVGQENMILDNAAVHIDNVERTIGSHGDVDGSEAFIR